MKDQWLLWARELQTLAQNGLSYTRDDFDRERFERLRQIAAQMMAEGTGVERAVVEDVFLRQAGYQTPKLDTRAAVVQDGRILLVQEKSGLWALPGGWVDAELTIRENTIKETLEEAGLDVRPIRLIAIHDHRQRNRGRTVWDTQKAFVLCELLGGSFQPNSETVASGWFALEDLPPLAESKTTGEQIALCFRAALSDTWETEFD